MNIAVVAPDYTNKALASPNVDDSVADVLLDKVALRGADGDTLKTLSDQLDAITSSLSAMGSNKKITITAAENIAEGEVVLSSSGGFIPESSLTDIRITQTSGDTSNDVGDADQLPSVCFINDNCCIITFSDASNSYYPTVRVAYILDDRTMLITATHYVLQSQNCNMCKAVSIGGNRFVVFMLMQADGHVDIVAGQWNSNGALTFGAITEIGDEATTAYNIDICQAANGKFAALLTYGASGNTRLRAGTVNSSTLEISLGDAAVIGTGVCTNGHIVQMDTDVVVALYEITSSTSLNATAATLSGTAITTGDNTQISDHNPYNMALAKISASKFVALMRDTTDSNVCAAVVGSLSGTVITAGAPATLSPGTDDTYPCGCLGLTDSVFLAIWDNDTLSRTQYSVSSFSGDTITPGAVLAMGTDFGNLPQAKGVLAKNTVNDLIYLGVSGGNIYAVTFDVAFVHPTHELYDVAGIADASFNAAGSGAVIVDGVKSGAASGLNPRQTYYFDSGYGTGALRKKDHGCIISKYSRRVRVLSADAMLSLQ